MAKRKTQTPADKAAAQIERIKEQVKSMVTGWQQRNVTREQWHEAHDLLADIYPLSPAQWEQLEETLCNAYEAWLRHNNLSPLTY